MTKKQFINLIIARINGGSFTIDAWKKAHPNIVSSYIELALSAAFSAAFIETSNYELYSKWHTGIAVEPHEITGLQKAKLPSTQIQTREKGNAVLRVIPTEDIETLVFLPSTSVEASASLRQGTAQRNGVIPYTTNGDYITFYGANNTTAVNILMIKSMSEYEDDDSLPIPQGKEDFTLSFVLKYLETNTPDKLTIDNNPNT